MNYCPLAGLVFSSANFYYIVQHWREILERLPGCTMYPLVPICTKAASWSYADGEPWAVCDSKSTGVPRCTGGALHCTVSTDRCFQPALRDMHTCPYLCTCVLKDLEAKHRHYHDVIGLSVYNMEIYIYILWQEKGILSSFSCFLVLASLVIPS